MHYYCEYIKSIFLVWKAYRAFFQLIILKKKIKEKKCILNSDRQNAILVNVLMYIQILINISYDLMHISCPQCGHVVWDIEYQ